MPLPFFPSWPRASRTVQRLKAAGKQVIELEIGDSPFPSTPSAKQAGHDAITGDQSHYAPSLGLPVMRQAAADYVRYGTPEYKDAHALRERAASRVPAILRILAAERKVYMPMARNSTRPM